MNRFILKAATLLAACILVAACGGSTNTLNIDHFTDEEIEIFPDYKDVTIPPNIAPLNFQVSVPSATRLIIEGKAAQLVVKSADGVFDIPMKQWKQLLQENRGGELRLTVCRLAQGRWEAFRPFCIAIADEPIDDYLVYRLVQPGYKYWHHMGIYQRRLETYEETPVYENRLTDYNCINCHSFADHRTETMLLHMRGDNAGTVVLRGDTLEKLNPPTDGSVSSLVYPSWHPSGNYVALSTNDTRQAFFMHNENMLEVFDAASDVIIYDAVRHELFTTPLLSSDAALETFPTFSPDGRSLYFCTARAIDDLPLSYKQVKYNLCRIDIDVDSRTFGTTVDTLLNATLTGKSVSFPRISPDGRFLALTVHDAGNFPIWHHDADLFLIDLADGSLRSMTAANSPTDTDSYHTWSSNSRWMVFSSRRIDGLYTRPFFTYIDALGNARKAFVLPQKNPAKHYADLFYSYNIPELVTGKVTVNPQHIARLMRNTPGTDVTLTR